MFGGVIVRCWDGGYTPTPIWAGEFYFGIMDKTHTTATIEIAIKITARIHAQTLFLFFIFLLQKHHI